MKNKNRPRRTKPKPKKPTKQKPFNPWVAKYFDLNGEGIGRRENGRCNQRTVLLGKTCSNQGNNQCNRADAERTSVENHRKASKGGKR
jgi:hypothetical protein